MYRVLIVAEDTIAEVISNTICEKYKRMCDVVQVDSKEEISRLEDEKSPDILFLSMSLKHINGLELLRSVRKKNKKMQTVIEPGLDYFLFDSKWYTEISNDESFQVSGHFRLQPYGDGTRRLIWINEYTKNGYHRKATIDKVKDGDIILS